MSSEATEIHIREQTKQVLKFLENGEIEKAREVVLNYKEILSYNFGLVNFVPLIPRIRFSKIIPNNYNALKMIIDSGYQIFSKEDNVNELLFFSAAKCDTHKLSDCVSKIIKENPNNINQTREGDTALMFLIKYGNLVDESCPDCIKILLDAGIDINRGDYFSHYPIIFLVKLYSRHTKRASKNDMLVTNLKKSIELLLETRQLDITSIKDENTTAKDLLKEHQFHGLDGYIKSNTEEQQADKLFKYLINSDEDNFKKCAGLSNLLDADDGNNTLLQLCCEKKLNEAAKFLIEKGADLSKTTERNQKSPIEIAARRNNYEIFESILKTNKIVIDEALFLTFLRNRPKHIKPKYFDEILKYKQLDVNILSNNGNTPLHYAIIFSNSEAIAVLLQRGASLTIENNSKKCPLDYISPDDLEAHLNKCIMPDNYTDIHNGKYEVALNYRNLIEMNDGNIKSELVIIEKISNSDKLYHLLNHPLISTFIDIKWKLVAPVYKKLFIFQLMFYLATIFSYINLNLLNYLGFLLAVVYSIRIALFFSWKNNKVHEVVDIMIAAIILLSVFFTENAIRYQLGVITTIFMALSFHLFWRFSPEFSKFHAILIDIASHIFSYILYTIILTLFFGAGSYIFFLIQSNNEVITNDKNFEIHIELFNDVKSILSHFYLVCSFGVFIAIMVIMTIVHSFVYLQENFSENIKNNFQILGHKNILIFLQHFEQIFRQWKIIRNPFVFEEICDTKFTYKEGEQGKQGDTGKEKKKQKKENKNKNKFLIHFYVNLNKFSFEKLHSVKLEEPIVSKIKKVVSR